MRYLFRVCPFIPSIAFTIVFIILCPKSIPPRHNPPLLEKEAEIPKRTYYNANNLTFYFLIYLLVALFTYASQTTYTSEA